MLRWIAIFVLLGLAACQSGTDITPTAAPTASLEPEEVTQVSSEGVTLALQLPQGWQSVPNDYGILLAEHTELNGSTTPNGILVYLFVQGLNDLDLSPDTGINPAFDLLDHVTSLPDASLSNATISTTHTLRLGAHEAAYYLLSDGHGNRTLVLAMAASDSDRVIVCNVSAPRHDAQRIRSVLPLMLENLTIDGQAIDMSGLELLPDPLVFPEHRRREDDDGYGLNEAGPASTTGP